MDTPTTDQSASGDRWSGMHDAGEHNIEELSGLSDKAGRRRRGDLLSSPTISLRVLRWSGGSSARDDVAVGMGGVVPNGGSLYH